MSSSGKKCDKSLPLSLNTISAVDPRRLRLGFMHEIGF